MPSLLNVCYSSSVLYEPVCVCVASPLIFFPLYSCSAERKKAVYIQNRTANIWSKMNFVFLAARSTTFFYLFSKHVIFFISHHTHSYGWLSYLKKFYSRSLCTHVHFSQTDKGTGQKDHSHITKLDVKYEKERRRTRRRRQHPNEPIKCTFMNH